MEDTTRAAKSTYLLDAENPAELTRLIQQENLLQATLELFPLCIPPEIVKCFTSILDVGCGAGGWVLDVAFRLPRCAVAGIDENKTMTDYARARARTQALPNASFEAQNALEPLAYNDETFECVHLRFPSSWVPKAAWGTLLKEIFRITCAGGYFIVTDTDIPDTTSPALNELHHLLARALYTSQRSFSVDGSTFGLVTVLGKLLLDAGFVDTQTEAHLLDFSSYQDGTNRVVRQNMQVAFGQLAGFIREYTGASEKHYSQILAMAEAEMWQNHFCGRGTLYTFTAHALK